MSETGYPETRTVDHVDERFGVRVPDPYRWLEDLDAPETRAWVRAQNELTASTLHALPERDALRARLERLLDYEKWSQPVQRGDRVFAMWNDGLRAQPVLVLMTSDAEAPEVLVDPNGWSADGTIALTAYEPSPDGARVAYAVATAGSDWTEWRIFDVERRELLDDRLERVRFSSPAWGSGGDRLYYAPLDEDEVAHLRCHVLGTDRADDALMYERPDHPSWRFQPVMTEDGRWLVIYILDQAGGPNGIACMDLGSGALVELPDAFRARFWFFGNEGSTFWFVTDLDAPRGRAVSIDLERVADGWAPLIDETVETMQWLAPKRDLFLGGYLRDACSVVRRFDADGRPVGEVELPGVGWAGRFGGARDDDESLYLFMSFTEPPTPYRYEVARDRSTLLRNPSRGSGASSLVTEGTFITSKDGTRVRLFLTHARNLERDGARPVLMWGYGGFGIPVVPWYWPLAIAWIERGGVFAVPAIRGGGEYGEEWHRAGSGANKQSSFDDFVAAAEWLIARGFTRPDKLAIAGGSNGGLLVGACITQRPDLFGAAHIDMGLLDMLHMDRVRVGLAMNDEYGSLEHEEDFKRLLGYSPLHNVRPRVRYPATIITTGDHDELVVPSNSYKFAAALQSAQASDAPVLLRVEPDTGHGVGKSTSKTLEEQTDVLTFLLRALGEI